MIFESMMVILISVLNIADGKLNAVAALGTLSDNWRINFFLFINFEYMIWLFSLILCFFSCSKEFFVPLRSTSLDNLSNASDLHIVLGHFTVILTRFYLGVEKIVDI